MDKSPDIRFYFFTLDTLNKNCFTIFAKYIVVPLCSVGSNILIFYHVLIMFKAKNLKNNLWISIFPLRSMFYGKLLIVVVSYLIKIWVKIDFN